MRGMGELNLPERLAPVLPRWVTEIGCAAISAAAAGVLRLTVDAFAPLNAPFVFVFPAALLATLLAGWRSGLLALTVLILGAWYMVLSPGPGFGPLSPEDASALILYGLSALLVIALAEGFRKAASTAGANGAAELEMRDLLLRELNHRVKNNFQMVASLLDLQRRRATEPATHVALGDALRRVHAMGQAHAYLYSPNDSVEAIDLAVYLAELCENLADSLLLTGVVRLEHSLAPAKVHRDRAVAVGLVVNELVTNAAKHAFPDGRPGTIHVQLDRIEVGIQLSVADDGVGLPPVGKLKTGGLGRRLVESFARQAGASLTQGDGPGARYVLVLPDQPAKV